MGWGEVLAGIGHVMTTVVLPVAATTAAAYGTQWAKRQAARAGVQLTIEQQQAIERQALNIVKRVEERSRRMDLTGAEKQQLATEVIKLEVVDRGKTLTDRQAGALIDTVLPTLRAEQALVDAPPVVTFEAAPAAP